jgi:hypothetical protein
MEERTIYLKIKVRSIADEAKSIRQEAKKTSGEVKWGLNHHRTTVVRDHARHNLLAYGILRGVPYRAMEQKCHERPKFSRVETIAKRFGATEEQVSSWVSDVFEYLDPAEEKVMPRYPNGRGTRLRTVKVRVRISLGVLCGCSPTEEAQVSSSCQCEFESHRPYKSA